MSFLNKPPTDGPTNRQDMLLDPEYVLSVFTTSDVSGMYETIMEDEDSGSPGGSATQFRRSSPGSEAELGRSSSTHL